MIENSDDHHGDERRNEHDAVEAVQNAAVAREDGAIILDAALALDHAGEQVAVDAQHSGHAGQQGNDHVHRNADVGAGERLHPVGRNGVDHGGDHTEHHGAQHAANGSLHGLFGADHGAEFVLAKGSACKVGAGIAAPGKAEDEQNKEHRVIAVGLHRQQLLQTDKGVEAEDHDAGKHHQTAGFCKIHLCVAHHQIDAEEQHHQKGGRHDQPPPHLIAGQHDQQGVGHEHGVHGPFLSAKAQGLEDLVDGDQGDGGNDKIEHQRVKGEQHPDQDEDAHNCGYDTSFHSNFSFWELQGSDAAKPAGALVELRDGGIQIITGEIRPEHIHLHQFGVSGLPEHEVGKALLARGTQDEIRVLLACGIHVVAHHLFGDVLGLEGALCHLLGQLPGGPHDLGAAAVVHGNVQGHAGLGGGVLLQLVHQLLELCIQRGPVAQELDADVAVLIVEALEQILAEQLHNGGDLFQRALPVLGGEGVEGHGRNAQLLAVVGDILKHGGTLFVARGAGQAPLLGPAAIAVHDDADGKALGKFFGMVHNHSPAFAGQGFPAPVSAKSAAHSFQRTAPHTFRFAAAIRRT